MTLRRSVWLSTAVVITVLVLAGCSDNSTAPGAPSADLGTVQNRQLPTAVTDLPLISDTGRTTTLAAMRGEVVVLADFLTLCQETCPLTTGNLLAMDRAVTAAGLAKKVRFVELTVDPVRDTPARLRAYRTLVGAPANWSLLTGTPSAIKRIWSYFGVWYQQVAEGEPPAVDWLTGKPLTYDISHEDVLFYLDSRGRERFAVVGSPNAVGAPVPPALRLFLSAEGRSDLAHPNASTWTASEALTPIAWLTGRPIGIGPG